MMKKLLLAAMGLLLGLSVVNAQDGFFEETTYRGAFDPDTTKDWTKGWANWTPKSTPYLNGSKQVVNVNPGDITTNTTWTADKIYVLNGGYVYVTNNATLTIEPGTLIKGSGKGTLIINRGSKIMAKGTSNAPIVFTSNNLPNLRSPGDWGGIVICGRAQHNKVEGDTAAAEGGIAKALPSGDGRYGGNDDEDNSGALEFVRIEFAGIPLTAASNSEINGLTMYSVGRQTSIHHVQVSFSGDDAYEWFGGTVNAKNLIALGTWDDDFDTDNGWRGKVQFAVSLRDPQIADQSGSTIMEADNDATGSTRTPQSAPVFSNVTGIGPIHNNNNTFNPLFTRALHIRRNTTHSVYNSIFTGFPQAGYYLDGKFTAANVCKDSLQFRDNIVAGIPSGWNFRLASSSDTNCVAGSASLKTWYTNGTNNNDTLSASDDVNLVRPFLLTNPNFAPNTGSVAATGANFNNFRLPHYPMGIVAKAIENVNEVLMYPNPANDVVNVEIGLHSKSAVSITILDLGGKVVEVINMGELQAGINNVKVNTANYESGYYLLQINAGNERRASKFTVNH